MAIKLIAIDMDGTLLLPDHTISPAVKNAIAAARARGVNVVLTTGRPYAGVHNYLKELHMEQPGDYCILITARWYRRPLMVTPWRKPLSAMTTTVSWKNSLAKSVLISTPWTAPRCTPPTEISATTRCMNLSLPPFRWCSAKRKNGPNTQFLKVMMIDEPAILDQAIARIPQEVKRKYTVLKSAPYFLEILDKRVNKGTGVKSLADVLGIKPEEIMAIGDQENDIAMIEYAGVGVAMDNAIPSVKEVANFVTKSNLEDGVAFAIEKYVLN